MTLYLLLGSAIFIIGIIRIVTVTDRVAQLIGLNITGMGSLVILLALAARTETIDPVISALVITGLVITVAFTGLGAVLIRRIEEHSGDSS